MNKQLTIALVAHDKRKSDMVEWAVFNAEMLSKHKLICTGTTGSLIQKAMDDKGVEVDITCMNSGPMGGDAEIAALVVRKQVNLAIFLIDDLNPHHMRLIFKCCFVSVGCTMCQLHATVIVLIL
jgi:methylglyoxal synthase